MKPNFFRFLGFTVALMMLMIFSANAQEGIPNNDDEIADFNYYPDLQEEKPLLFELEKSTSNTERVSNNKDQLSTTPKSGKSKSGDASKTTATKPEDDALSFNFLYYIIQKFKISDIVEQ